jgi:hypothetical protein
MIQVIAGRRIHALFRLHGRLHDRVVRTEGIKVILFRRKRFALDALAEAVLGNHGNNLGSVLFLGSDPTDHLVHGRNVSGNGSVQLSGLHNGLANSGGKLLHLGNHGTVGWQKVETETCELSNVFQKLGKHSSHNGIQTSLASTIVTYGSSKMPQGTGIRGGKREKAC